MKFFAQLSFKKARNSYMLTPPPRQRPFPTLPLNESEAKLVGDHGDELGVGGLAALAADGVAEVAVESVNVAAIPGDLDSVANGALDAGGGGVEGARNTGIDELGHVIDNIGIGDGHADGAAEIIKTLDVSGDSEIVKGFGDLHFKAVVKLEWSVHGARILNG